MNTENNDNGPKAKKAKKLDTDERRFRTNKISNLVRNKTSASLKKLGFQDNTIVAKWGQIAGPQIAAYSLPTKMTFARGAQKSGTLHVMVEGAYALQLQHAIPLLIEKINMYFGFALVSKIVMTQGPVEKRNTLKRRVSKPLDEQQSQKLKTMVEGTKNEGLRDALAKLGSNILNNTDKD